MSARPTTFLRRVLDSVWIYVSPRATDAGTMTPASETYADKAHQASIKRPDPASISDQNDSQSPTDRKPQRKRRRTAAEDPETNNKARRKMSSGGKTYLGASHQEDVPMYDDGAEEQMAGLGTGHHEALLIPPDSAEKQQGELYSEDYANYANDESGQYSTTFFDDDDDDNMSAIFGDMLIDDAQLHQGTRRKTVLLPPEHIITQAEIQAMRADGWDEAHISLVRSLSLRGHEPILPYAWFKALYFVPASVFASNDETLMTPYHTSLIAGEIMMTRMLYLGPDVRAQAQRGLTDLRPEELVRRYMRAYLKWALKDTGLHGGPTIPLCVLIVRPLSTGRSALENLATRRLARLAAKYRKALGTGQTKQHQLEQSTQSQYHYPLPTLYAIVATHTFVAIAAYRPGDPNPEAEFFTGFSFNDPESDFWNVVGIAMVVLFARDARIRIAQETGLGLTSLGEVDDDPDL